MAANEQVGVVPLLKKQCNYCKNSTKSGVSCSVCGLNYHPSCAQRVKMCCGIELQTKLEETIVPTVSSMPNAEVIFLKEENKLLKQMIGDKEVIIQDKSAIISLLEQKISMLEDKIKGTNFSLDKNQGNTSKEKIPGISQKQTYADKIKTNSIQGQSTQNKNFNVNNGEKNNLELMQEKQRDIMQSVIDLCPINNDNNELNKEKKEWKTVETKRKPRAKQIGEVENNGSFKGLNPKVWMYIYRVIAEVTEDDIKEYLGDKTGDDKTNFTVKLLKTTKSNLKCFMVAADFKFKDDFYNRSFWPKGVGYRRFDFKTDSITDTPIIQPNSFLEKN